MGALEIFYWCPSIFYVRLGVFCCVSWRYLICVLVIFDGCFGDILWVSWRYLGVLEIFDGSPRYI